jgi:hypothetical protein
VTQHRLRNGEMGFDLSQETYQLLPRLNCKLIASNIEIVAAKMLGEV